MSDEKVAAMIEERLEAMRDRYQGHCMNRWRDPDDINQLNALNQVGKSKLEIVK